MTKVIFKKNENKKVKIKKNNIFYIAKRPNLKFLFSNEVANIILMRFTHYTTFAILYFFMCMFIFFVVKYAFF